jgi:hypothetical protein
MTERFLLEGTWSGYRAKQRRVVHREAVDKAFIDSLKLRTIIFSDDTTLTITTRPMAPRERVMPMRPYFALIREARDLDLEVVEVVKMTKRSPYQG